VFRHGRAERVCEEDGDHASAGCAAGRASLRAAAQAKASPPGYLVGAATRSINPDPDGTFAGKPVYLGGYGIGGGSPVFQGRPATGVLGDGVSVRAFAVSDGHTPFAIADIEAQGWFVALKSGPYGLLDMRKEVEQRTGGALPAENVVGPERPFPFRS